VYQEINKENNFKIPVFEYLKYVSQNESRICQNIGQRNSLVAKPNQKVKSEEKRIEDSASKAKMRLQLQRLFRWEWLIIYVP
jgi:hypothetical protein